MNTKSPTSFIKVTIPLAIVIILFFTLAPANMKDKLIGLIEFNSDARKCFNFHKEDFIDPDSAYLDSSYVWTKKDELEIMKDVENMVPTTAFQKYDAILRVSAYGKNKMGGYVSIYLECPLVSGHFDRHSAFMHKFEKYDGEAEAAPAALP